MAELKTKRTDGDVEAFLAAIEDDAVQLDCRTLVSLMTQASGAAPAMWGSSIVGFGERHFRYASGREGDWFTIGFAPRKRSLTLYLMDGVEAHADRLARLGPHSTGKGCLYIKRLADVDTDVLAELITDAAR